MARLPTEAEMNPGLPQQAGLAQVRPVVAQDVRATDFSGLTNAVNDIAHIAHQETQKLDALKAEDALNKIRQHRLDLTLGEQGAYSIKGGEVLDANYANGYKARMSTGIEGIMASLSPAQRARLQPHANSELLGLQTDVLRHSMGEAERYKASVRQNSLDTRVNTGIQNWGDSVNFDKSFEDIKTVVMGIARESGITGKTEDEQLALAGMVRKASSPMFVGAVTAALDTQTPAGLDRAEEIFKKSGLMMDPSARLQLGEHIQKAREAQTVQAAVQTTVADIVSSNTPVSRLATSLAASIDVGESGKNGRHYTGTQVLLGPMTSRGEQAVGKHQIMPSSAPQDAREAGLPWDKELFYSATPAGEKYHDALQQAHVSRLIRIFGNDPAAIAAAYNAGEGAVLKAQKEYASYLQTNPAAQARARAQDAADGVRVDGGPGTGFEREAYSPPVRKSFLDFLPKETQNYVPKVLAAFRATPDVVRPSSREVSVAMRNQYPDRPDLAARAAAAVEQQLAQVETARKTEIDTTKEEAYKRMAQGVTFDQLPPSLLAKLPVLEQDSMRKTFDEHLSGRRRDSDPDLLATYNSNAQALAQVPSGVWAGEMRMQLSEYDWQRLDKQRSLLKSGDMKDAGGLDSGIVHNILTERLRMLDIHPKESDTRATMIANSARAVLDEAVLEQQARIGRRLTYTETQQLVDEQFRNSVKLKTSLLPSWLGGGEPTKTSVMQMGYNDIPRATRNEITAALKAEGVANPTDVQVLTWYKQHSKAWGSGASRAPSSAPRAEAASPDDYWRASNG